MRLTNHGNLKFFIFEAFPSNQVTHGIFTRHGGVSPKPWNELNVGGTVGDDLENVRVNIRRTFDVFNLDVNQKYDVWQVHGNDVIFTDKPRIPNELPRKADIILTNKPEVILFMRFADCVPIFLYDPIKRVVGIAHAGWLGTVRKVASVAIQAMVEHYGSLTSDIVAGIGPSIGPEFYEIGEDVAHQIRETFNDRVNDILSVSTKENKAKIKLNLWKARQVLLEAAGVRQIEVVGICTAENVSYWYSHRAEFGKTGRFGALLTLGS